jgi:hypothetical protein
MAEAACADWRRSADYAFGSIRPGPDCQNGAFDPKQAIVGTRTAS